MTSSELSTLVVLRRMQKDGSARSLRTAAGISLNEMARACGVKTAATVCRWESGSRRPRGVQAERYAAALVELAELDSLR